jgi:hypothetical protein
MLRSHIEARADALSERSKVFPGKMPKPPMAIVLVSDDHGIPTHEYCPETHVDLLYGPLIKAEVARVVEIVP